MKISISEFGGISPKTNPRYLGEGGAQIALNVEAYGESLKPLNGLSETVTTLPKSGTLQTIYRFGQDYVGEDRYWFHWAADVDVCRSQIPNDASEWTYYTGMGYPRVTNNVLSMAGGGMEYPTTSRRMGLLAPTTPLIAAVPDLALAKGVAKVTLDDTTLSELSSDYPIKLSFSSDTGVTWTEKTVAVAGAKAASVTLSASDLAEVKPSYGVYVSLTDGATKVRCRINGKVDADPASVTIPASGFDTIGYMGEVRVSLDGGETYDVATYTSQDKVTAARLARLIDGVMGNKIITQVVGSAVRLSTTTSGAGVSLLVYYGRPGSYTELYATGSDGSLTNAAAIVAAAINADASALVTATAVSGTVVVTALRLGARIKLWVAWGPDVTARHTSTGQAVRPTNVASAIDAVAGLSAVVVGTAVMVSTDAAGDKMALKVQWGDDPWQVRTANGTTKDPGTPTTRHGVCLCG